MGRYLFNPGLLHLSGVSHNLWLPGDFATYILVLKLLSHITIANLGQLGEGDEGDVGVVFFTLYFMRLCLYAVNSKNMPWEERTIYH